MTAELCALAASLTAKKSDSETVVATVSVGCDGYASAESAAAAAAYVASGSCVGMRQVAWLLELVSR